MEPQVDQSFKATIDELQRVAREADKIDKERVELFHGLLKHPGWTLYSELISARIQIFSDEVLAPAGSVDRAIALEWIKGAMSGLLIAQGLPNVIIDAMKPAVPATDEDET